MPLHGSDKCCVLVAPSLDSTQSKNDTDFLLWQLVKNQEAVLELAGSTNAILTQLLRTQGTIMSRLDELQVKRPKSKAPTQTRKDGWSVQSTTTMNNTSQSGKGEDFRSFCEIARGKASSFGHFACMIVQQLFSREERVGRNCRGKRGKEALDAVKLEQVKQTIFEYYNVPPEEQAEHWKESMSRIDEMLRRKPRTGEAVQSS